MRIKPGTRTLAISETALDRKRSLLVGVVSTRTFLEDVRTTFITYGGLDATEGIIRLWKAINRPDLRLILLSGWIIAGYNVVDVVELHQKTGLPVAVIPRNRPKKRMSEILSRFNDDRVMIYEKVRPYSVPLTVGNRRRIGVVIGTDIKDLERFLNSNLIGNTPYPIYLSDRIARGLRESFKSGLL